MVSRIISFLITLFFFAVHASSLQLPQKANREVFVPTINIPNSTTTWVIGNTESVTWLTSDAPEDISNGASVILNGYSTPLATDFDLRSGKVNFQVPYDVQPGLYYITLFGDSGDTSQYFRIVDSLS